MLLPEALGGGPVVGRRRTASEDHSPVDAKCRYVRYADSMRNDFPDIGGQENGLICESRSVGFGYARAGAGRSVLLVHGNLAGKSWWREVLAKPAPGHQYLAPNLPGFGDSAKGSNFVPSIRGYARSMLLYLDSLGISRTALVGHSLGGAVAMELVSQAPDRFTALMLVDSVSPGGLHTPFYYYPYLRMMRDDRQALHRALEAAMPSRRPPYFEELVDEAVRMHPYSFAGNARALDGWRAPESLGRYSGPVELVAGEYDSLSSPLVLSSTADTFESAASKRVVRLPGVGHSPHIESPQLFRDELEALLDAAA